jgi:hypothetical protein
MVNRILKENMKLKIEVEVAIIKEDNYFVAYCPALELSAYGDKEANAKKSFNVEVAIFLDETCQRGTLEKYLIKNGWKLQLKNYEPPRTSAKIMDSLIKSQARVISQQIQIPAC